uniref:FAS1 domain-containing protein n=1 Tax=Tetradesmus obliquus TaxID=3088 RepID=A0A383VMY1_TETOB|eukprot:jgi/Sobl393_1/14154/SZX65776.1
MNPPVLESGPATTSAAPAGANAAGANAAGTNATGTNAAGANAAGNNAAEAKSTLSNTTYPTLEAALTAANVTTLAAAVQAAGLPANATGNVTILAPTNKAFTQRLQKDLQMTPQQLLQNKTLLVEVLSYHIIPGVVRSSQLTDRQTVPTALAGAKPLVVRFDRTNADGSRRRVPQIEFKGATDKAEVRTADLPVGNVAVVHVVNDVLLPAGVGKSGKTTSG